MARPGASVRDPLRVTLGSTDVGTLELTTGGERIFRFDRSYESSASRRVLGQYFEDRDRREPFVGREALPPFFANLLPQGELRKHLAAKLDLRAGQDFHLLAALGGDLPGDLRVLAPRDMPAARARERVSRTPKTRPADEAEHYFSLAGMQLKFSMVAADSGLTLPSKNADGRFIVKLPDVQRAGVPETELAMLEWARAAGMDVVEAHLEPLGRVSLAYDELPALAGATALAVRRFDRVEDGRLHQEDFAQVLGIEPDDKYAVKDRSQRRLAHRAETLVSVLAALAPESVAEAILRMVFMVICGNEDAHLKNWSLLYDADGIHPRLSPAYDLVCTVAFASNRRPKVALAIGGERDMEVLTVDHFRGLAGASGLGEDEVARLVRGAAEKILDLRPAASALPDGVGVALDRHLASLSLASVRPPRRGRGR
jgi:serine/threonine-protein kinase HipA